MNPELHLRIAGTLQIALAVAHVTFPRRFQWKEELSRLSLLNRQIFIVHTLFICVVLAMFGSLSAFAPQALLERTQLSRWVLGGIAGFWALRLVVQWLGYDSSLWRGNSFNTFVHFLFTAIWLYLAAVYAGVLFAQSEQ